MMKKCPWAQASAVEERYHDHEWGVPIHNDRLLFEFLILEGAQAGLSWRTVLNKRENYRRVFDNFEPERVAVYDEAKIQSLMVNPEIIRNKLKIRSAVTNARAFLKVSLAFGSFDHYIWRFVGHMPIQNRWAKAEDVPSSSSISNAMSKDLKKRGFKFVGTTICYAYMQAIGMVNDHVVDCFRYQQLNN